MIRWRHVAVTVVVLVILALVMCFICNLIGSQLPGAT